MIINTIRMIRQKTIIGGFQKLNEYNVKCLATKRGKKAEDHDRPWQKYKNLTAYSVSITKHIVLPKISLLM